MYYSREDGGQVMLKELLEIAEDIAIELVDFIKFTVWDD